MKHFKKVKKILNFNISDKLLTSLVFEMSRKKDKEFVKKLREIQNENNTVFNTVIRNKIRKYFYFGKEFNDVNEFKKYNIEPFEYNNDEIEVVFKDFYERLNNYNPDNIISSLRTNARNYF